MPKPNSGASTGKRESKGRNLGKKVLASFWGKTAVIYRGERITEGGNNLRKGGARGLRGKRELSRSSRRDVRNT